MPSRIYFLVLAFVAAIGPRAEAQQQANPDLQICQRLVDGGVFDHGTSAINETRFNILHDAICKGGYTSRQEAKSQTSSGGGNLGVNVFDIFSADAAGQGSASESDSAYIVSYNNYCSTTWSQFQSGSVQKQQYSHANIQIISGFNDCVKAVLQSKPNAVIQYAELNRDGGAFTIHFETNLKGQATVTDVKIFDVQIENTTKQKHVDTSDACQLKKSAGGYDITNKDTNAVEFLCLKSPSDNYVVEVKSNQAPFKVELPGTSPLPDESALRLLALETEVSRLRAQSSVLFFTAHKPSLGADDNSYVTWQVDSNNFGYPTGSIKDFEANESTAGLYFIYASFGGTNSDTPDGTLTCKLGVNGSPSAIGTTRGSECVVSTVSYLAPGDSAWVAIGPSPSLRAAVAPSDGRFFAVRLSTNR